MAEMSQAEEALTQATEGASAPAVKDSRPVYEVGFHIVSTVAEDEVGAVVEKIRNVIGPEVEVISESFPAKMTLAYVVERSSQGKREKYGETYFGWIKFAAERESIPTLQEKLRAMNEILRYLVVETVREDVSAQPRRAVFASDRLWGAA